MPKEPLWKRWNRKQRVAKVAWWAFVEAAVPEVFEAGTLKPQVAGGGKGPGTRGEVAMPEVAEALPLLRKAEGSEGAV